MSVQNTNHLIPEIYRLEDNIKELQLENERNEVRRKTEAKELQLEIDELIMKNAMLDAENNRLRKVLALLND